MGQPIITLAKIPEIPFMHKSSGKPKTIIAPPPLNQNTRIKTNRQLRIIRCNSRGVARWWDHFILTLNQTRGGYQEVWLPIMQNSWWEMPRKIFPPINITEAEGAIIKVKPGHQNIETLRREVLTKKERTI